MKNLKVLLVIFALFFATSCGSYYRMITVLDKNGDAQREIYTHGNENFMNGEDTEHPFLFQLDSTWNICRFDSVVLYNYFGNKEENNVKISKRAPFIEQFSNCMLCDEDKRPLAAPKESLLKKKRWFYTTYSFKAVYHKFQYTLPVSIEDYLSKDEQTLWTQGDMDSYKVMNGYEMNEYLMNISNNFYEWQSRNKFEISLKLMKELTSKFSLDTDKEAIYKLINELFEKENIPSINPDIVCKGLDVFYKTKHFSMLYTTHSAILNENFEKATSLEQLIPNVISYELVVPGQILQTNAPIIATDTLTWKVDGMRLLFDDYSLTAEYRIINPWAFWLTGSLLLVALCSSLAVVIKRRK